MNAGATTTGRSRRRFGARAGTMAALLLCAAAAPAFADGELLVGNKSGDTLWRLDLETGRKLGEAPTGHAPHEIAVAPDGTVALVSNYGSGDAPGNTLSVVTLGQGALGQSTPGEDMTRTLSLGDNTRPHGLRWLPDGRRALVTTEGSDTVVVVDIAAGKVEREIDVGPGKVHLVVLSADGRLAWASKVEGDRIVRINLGDGRVREAAAGNGAEGIALARDGTVWVGNREDGTVTVHDPDALDILATLPSPGFPIRVNITPDGRHALVTNARAATLSVFDTATREPVATVALAPEGVEFRETMLGRAALPIGAIATADGKRVFVAISGADRIAVIDTGTWKVVEYWETGAEPDALGIVPAAAAP